MTKQEIKDLVAAKIAGQGSMVDVGGALPTIINEVVDLIPESTGPSIVLLDKNMYPQDENGNIFVPQAKLTELINSYESGDIVRVTDGEGGGTTMLSARESTNWHSSPLIFWPCFASN